jgi:hypothetical protein
MRRTHLVRAGACLGGSGRRRTRPRRLSQCKCTRFRGARCRQWEDGACLRLGTSTRRSKRSSALATLSPLLLIQISSPFRLSRLWFGRLHSSSIERFLDIRDAAQNPGSTRVRECDLAAPVVPYPRTDIHSPRRSSASAFVLERL